MASANLGEDINCSICMDIFTTPVTLSCGHSYCRECIKRTWDSQEERESSCPECRQRFRIRPELKINWKLRNIAERLRVSQPVASQNRTCTYCERPTAKTCLHCAIYLCEMHLSVHSTTDGHDLAEPTGLLENRNCSVHNELLRYYCSQHNACICQACYVSREHRGHQVESLFEASERKKEKLRKVLGRLTSRKKDTEKRVSVLKDHMREFEEQANSMEVRVMALIRDMKEQLDILEKRVLSEISRQRGQVFIHISDLVQELEIKKDELFAKILQIEEVCNMNDPFSVLQGRGADRVVTYNAEMEGNGERYDGGAQAVGELDEVLVSVTLQTAFDDMVTRLKSRNPLFLPSLSDIELDVNTAANNIVISRDLKTASWSLMDQCYPQVPGRMETCQVLSTKSIPSRHYWEVETSGSGEFHVGISYSNLNVDQPIIGYNKSSWCLELSEKEVFAVHDSKVKLLHTETSCKRLGIYLDYEAGRLSFYQLCGPIRCVYTFTATFTKPLYAMFYVFKGWVKISS